MLQAAAIPKAMVLLLVMLVLLGVPQLHATNWGTPDLQAHKRSMKLRRLLSINNSSRTALECATYNLTAIAGNAVKPKVIDCFLMSTELDMAEIRLRELQEGRRK